VAKLGLRLAVCAVVGLGVVPLEAEARIASVTVNTTRQYENASNYTYSEITIRGDVGASGHYTVPATIIFPRTGGNNIGVVDWINNAFYHFFPASTEFGTFQFTLLGTGNYLFQQGYTYMTIQWDKMVTGIWGPTPPNDGQPHNNMVYGVIEHGADAWEILLDAGRFLDDPTAYPKSGNAPRPRGVDEILSSGYSMGAGAQLEVLAANRDPSRVYDGHLIQAIGSACFKRDDTAPHFGFFGDCAPLPSRSVPVIALPSQTDMVVYHPTALGFGKSAYFLRNTSNNKWRSYEMAAVAHIPKPVLDLGVPNQSIGDPHPIFRQAFDNLNRWVRNGTNPPASRFYTGTVDGTNQFVPVIDGDGNWAGGLRLPHVGSTINGLAAGAPLGVYEPINAAGFGPPFNPFAYLSGTYTRYSDDELQTRYPTRTDYVNLVSRAANNLAQTRYISQADANAIIAQAQVEPLP
jgi:hypothetical protein